MIYEGSPAKYLPGLATTIGEKLAQNIRCLYLNAPAIVAGIRSYLFAAGVDVNCEVNRGALALSSDQAHLSEGRFDIDKMLAMLEKAISTALNDGHVGLWAAGDMTWEFGLEKNFAKLREYEIGLEELFQKNAAFRAYVSTTGKRYPLTRSRRDSAPIVRVISTRRCL